MLEDRDILDLTCGVPESGRGNPHNYMYSWIHVTTGQTYTSLTDKLTIDSNTLDVTLHDGMWQCQAENTVGQSQAGSLQIIVNGQYILFMRSGYTGMESMCTIQDRKL